jgi:hypothetical protein
MRAAHRLQLAAGPATAWLHPARREDGIGWQEIGALLELGAAAAERGALVTGAAFGFAPAAVRLGQVGTFSWQCRQCGQAISDRGPGPRSSRR